VVFTDFLEDSMFIKKTLSLFIIFSIFTSFPVFGREGRQSYQISDLVNLALQRSELLIASDKAVESARWLKGQAKAWQNPSVSLGAGYKSNSGKNGAAYDIGLSQPFYFPGKQQLAGDIAGVQEKIAGLGRDETRLFIRYNVIKLAYQYVVASELAKHLEERVRRYNAIQIYLSSRPFPSPRKRMEKHIIEMKLPLLKKELAEIRSGKDIAWARLNLFLNLPSPIAIDPPWFDKGIPLKLEDVVSSVEKNNIDLKRQTLILERTEAESKLAKKFIFPDFSLSFLFSEERVSKDVERFIGGGLTFNIPLWNTNKGNVKSLEAGVSAEKAKLEYAKREAMQFLLSSFIEYENARQNLERLPLPSIREVHRRVVDADESFNNGLIDLITYNEVESQAYETHLALFGAQYDYVVKYTALCILQGSEEFAFVFPKNSKE